MERAFPLCGSVPDLSRGKRKSCTLLVVISRGEGIPRGEGGVSRANRAKMPQTAADTVGPGLCNLNLTWQLNLSPLNPQGTMANR